MIDIWSASEYTGQTKSSGNVADCAKAGIVRMKTYDKILFVGKHNFHCVDIISAIGFVYNEFVFLQGNN